MGEMGARLTRFHFCDTIEKLSRISCNDRHLPIIRQKLIFRAFHLSIRVNVYALYSRDRVHRMRDSEKNGSARRVAERESPRLKSAWLEGRSPPVGYCPENRAAASDLYREIYLR